MRRYAHERDGRRGALIRGCTTVDDTVVLSAVSVLFSRANDETTAAAATTSDRDRCND